MKLRVPVLMAMGFCCTAYAADYLGGFEGPYGQGRLDVTNDMTVSEVALTGMVYKTGSAELTLENPRSPAGGLSVNRASALVSVVDAVSSLGDLATAGGTDVGVDVATGGNLAVGGIRTGVPLVKTGAGMLSGSGDVVLPRVQLVVRQAEYHQGHGRAFKGLARFRRAAGGGNDAVNAVGFERADGLRGEVLRSRHKPKPPRRMFPHEVGHARDELTRRPELKV